MCAKLITQCRKSLFAGQKGLLLTLLCACEIIFLQSAVATDVRFSVEGVNKSGGEIVLYVYDKENASDFPSGAGEYLCKETVAMTDNSIPAIVACLDFKSAEFAVFAFHDVNGNGVLDHSFIGIPKEQLGFSGGCKIRFGPPKFSSCAVSLEAGQTTVSVQML